MSKIGRKWDGSDPRSHGGATRDMRCREDVVSERVFPRHVSPTPVSPTPVTPTPVTLETIQAHVMEVDEFESVKLGKIVAEYCYVAKKRQLNFPQPN